jgi:integrase
MSDFLTSDNFYLSRPNSDRVPVNCTELPDTVLGYIRASLADNTRRAYLSDLAHFENWGGAIPASAETVARYLAAHADTLRVATLVRRIALISKAHQARGAPNPTRSELVRTMLKGIKRTRRCAQRQAKPLLRDDLLLVLDAMSDGQKDIRDRALLLVGFAGALRRSELISLDVADVAHVRRGITLQLRHSKTDQEGRGDKIAIPYGRGRWCPVDALAAWLQVSWSNIPADRPARPRPWWTPIRRSRLNRGPRESSRHRSRPKGLLRAFATGWLRDKRRSGRRSGVADQGANPTRLRRHVGTLHSRRGPVQR